MIHIASEQEIDFRHWRTQDGESNAEQLKRLLAHLPRAMDEELTERQRQILRLHFYENMSITQIARELHIQPSTVTRSLQRSARRLQRVLRYTV